MMKIFRSDTRLPKWMMVALFPVMLVASAIALVLYLCFLFISVLVIQTAGALLSAYSVLKFLHDGTLRIFSHVHLPHLHLRGAR